MKRTLSILLAVMMLLSVAACNNAPASKKLTRGTWTGDEYANEFAGVRFTMPEGFVKLSDEELSEALSEALSLGQEFIDATEDELKLAELNTVYDAMVQDPSTGVNVIIMFEKVTSIQGGDKMTAEEYVSILTEQLKSQTSFNYEIGEAKTEEFCGEEYVTFEAEMVDYETFQKMYVRKIGNYFAGFTFSGSAVAETGYQTLIDAFQAY